ncbi:O-antigen/teichoic acid export membrane protein [Silvibacterium bohemicum]|uniref:O-antigen/teichoic acid export membrane protein n=1 Tax=Silvibacterium bohemicum TaxID=1577686 RepID=A0A841K4L4_9BACT|nr:oligosaccharide flippase family protein [Silvibacterium bohemicum]MBB6145204.1 O-antigen/teichoic acid export membrane protein [Silvibacterium bohemicum]
MFDLMRRSVVARNTAWMFAGQGLRLGIQAAYFTAIARSLGVSNYGAFVGVTAFVAVAFPFGSLGSGHLLIRQVAKDKSAFARCWGEAIGTTVSVSAILLGILLIVSRFLIPATIPTALVFLVAFSDLFGLSIIGIAGQAFQAFELLKWTAVINIMISSCRLIGALLLIAFVHHPSPLQWGYIYFGSTLAVVIAAYLMVTQKLGSPKISLRRSPRQILDGVYFSISLSAQSIYNDIDKTMLVRLSTFGATGIYGAAYRLIDVSFSPVSALLYAAYPKFFRQGAGGLGPSLAHARSLLRKALLYASVICVGILLLAGVVPHVLGAEYARTVEALRWLAPLPILKTIHYFISDALTGAGHQALRSGIQASVAVFNVLINLWLIPAYSWRGAAWASIASDGLLACLICTAAFVLSRRSQKKMVLQVQ